MLFNSLDFAIFLPIVFIIYWFVLNNNLKLQNLFLLFSSYVFYGWWDYRFLSILAFSSLVDYTISHRLYNVTNPRVRKQLLALSLLINLGMLGIFKYYNFFVESFHDAFASIGVHLNVYSLKIILPVGISFYTFQTLSYTIDVYKKAIKPTKDIIAFFAFVSFFPQLVAGPIERATNLLPQFFTPRIFSYRLASDGLKQIVWGLFKKVVIADNCAIYVYLIFKDYENLSGSELMLGAIYFAFQIYGDFSGYSDIAIGTAKLFGFKLMTNFAYPYFSRDVAEFWRRWHISLSTWFRDYVYIPLGGSRGNIKMSIRNTVIVFTVSGLWHGAKWTFVVWGALHALFFIPLLITGHNRNHIDIVAKNKILPSFKELIQMLYTFLLVTIAWIFFRATNLREAFRYLNNMFSKDLFSIPDYIRFLPLIIIFIIIEWLQRDKEHALNLDNLSISPRWVIYVLITWLTVILGNYNIKEFIYFQF